jgi:AAHS family 3-hydroxyphenylpropionic acid transporter
MTIATTSQRPNSALIVVLCFLVAVVEGFDLQVMSGIGPLIRGQLHLSPQQLGFIFSSSLVGMGIGATLGGYVSDRIGRKRVIVLAAFAMSFFTLTTAAAFDYWSLFLARFLTGLALGGAMPNTLVMVESTADRRHAAGVVTLMLCGIPAGGVVAALASHGFAENMGWRGVLVFGGVFALLIATGAQLWLTDQEPTAAHRQSKAGLIAVLFGEGRAVVTILLWTLTMLSLAIVALLATWLPTLVVDRGLPDSAAFSTLLAWNVGGIFGIVVVGRICDRLGPRNALLLGYSAMAALFVLFAKSNSASTFIIFAVVVNFFVAGTHYTIYGLSPRLYPETGAGTGVGTNMAIGRVGSVLGPSVAGIFLGTGSSGGQVILGLTPIAIVCAILVLVLVAASRGKLDRPVGPVGAVVPADS